jgi:hypothetical protein
MRVEKMRWGESGEPISQLRPSESVELGRRHADMTHGRERLIADGVGPSAHLVVVVEIHTEAGTVITAYAMRRVPSAWRRL